MSGRILVDRGIVDTHKTGISGHSSSFNVSFSNVGGGTASAITDANNLGVSAGGISGRYASALPNSANDIQRIANILNAVDTNLAGGMRAQ